MNRIQHIMDSRQIEHLNAALQVLKHFINLSAKLLPFLDELQRKRHPSYKERLNKAQIIEIYQNYNFDVQASEHLLDSNVLALIKDSFEQISRPSHFLQPANSTEKLIHFMNEYKRLTEKWGHIDAN